MNNRRLRVLVADAGFARRLHIERMFNALGCYGVLPVESFAELQILGCSFTPYFDVLIANENLIVDAGSDFTAFCAATSHIGCRVFYGGESIRCISNSFSGDRLHASLFNARIERELSSFFNPPEVVLHSHGAGLAQRVLCQP